MGAATAAGSNKTENDHHALDHRPGPHRHRGPHHRQLRRALPVLALAPGGGRRPRGLDQVPPAPLPAVASLPPGRTPAPGQLSEMATSVRDAGELLASALELAGPLARPAERPGRLPAQVGGRGTTGEVDVLAPVHPPRVGAVGVAREMPGQLPEEPVHDLRPPAVPPERVEPVAAPAGAAG